MWLFENNTITLHKICCISAKQASLIALDLDKSLTFRKEKRPFFIVHLIEILQYFCIKYAASRQK